MLAAQKGPHAGSCTAAPRQMLQPRVAARRHQQRPSCTPRRTKQEGSLARPAAGRRRHDAPKFGKYCRAPQPRLSRRCWSFRASYWSRLLIALCTGCSWTNPRQQLGVSPLQRGCLRRTGRRRRRDRGGPFSTVTAATSERQARRHALTNARWRPSAGWLSSEKGAAAEPPKPHGMTPSTVAHCQRPQWHRRGVIRERRAPSSADGSEQKLLIMAVRLRDGGDGSSAVLSRARARATLTMAAGRRARLAAFGDPQIVALLLQHRRETLRAVELSGMTARRTPPAPVVCRRSRGVVEEVPTSTRATAAGHTALDGTPPRRRARGVAARTHAGADV